MKFSNVERILFCFLIIFSSFILFLSFYNLYGITQNFPLKQSDISEHMANFHYMLKYGFHGFVPNWYGGYTLFLYYPPLFHYFIIPFYFLTWSIPWSFYLGIIFTWVALLAAIILVCKTQKFSHEKTAALFLVVFATRLSLVNYFIAIRVGENIAWVFFILLFTLVLHYKDKALDKSFFITYIVLLTMIILSHFYMIVFGCLLMLPFIIIKKRAERIKIIISTGASLLITSFWWLPFLMDFLFGNRYKQILFPAMNFSLTETMRQFWIFVVPIYFWLSFYLYFKDKRDKKDLYMMIPFLIFSVLVFTKTARFIPVLNEMTFSTPCMLFMFFATFYLFNKKTSSGTLYKLIIILICVFLPLISAYDYLNSIDDFFFTQYNSKPAVKEMAYVMDEINGSFMISPEYDKLSFDYTFRALPFFCYGAIYHNLTTPSGWFPPAASADRILEIRNLDEATMKGNCSEIYKLNTDMKVDVFISYGANCKRIENCTGLVMKIKSENVCVFDVV